MRFLIILLIVLIHSYSFAESTMMTAVKNNKFCTQALLKYYTQANTDELNCLSIYNYSKALKKYQSYRAFTRIKLLRAMKKTILKMLKSDQDFKDINFALNNEIKKNIHNLKGIKWMNKQLVYFDAEISPKGVHLIYGLDTDKIIQMEFKFYPIGRRSKDKRVAASTPDYGESVVMKGLKEIEVPVGNYNRISIFTEHGVSDLKFSKDYKPLDVLKIAYEINAQLYDRKAPNLNDVKFQFYKRVVNQ